MINHIAYTASKSMIAKAIADHKHISYLLLQITSNYSDMHYGRIYQDINTHSYSTYIVRSAPPQPPGASH